jgi:uncharacterized protein YaeQ
MALTATLRRFSIALADADRGVYADLELRAAQHPSESDRYLVARVLARCLEHGEGVDFTRGLAAADEPALWQRDLRGDLQAWVEVGSPGPERLHRASKTGARVVVYAWKGAAELAREISAQRIHRAQEVEIRALDAGFLDRIAAGLERSQRWELSVSGATLYWSRAGAHDASSVERIAVP